MELCLFSVSYAGLWGQQRLSLPDFIQRAKELGFASVMLMGKRPHLSVLDYRGESLAELRNLLDAACLECSVIGGYTDFAGGGAAEVPHVEMQIAYVDALARMGKVLGARVIRVFTSYETSGLPFQAQWDRTVTALRECCDRAHEHGLTIAVQNHHDVGVESTALEELLGDVDRQNCKLGFDAWSPALRGENLYEVARRLAPHIACTTNAGYIRLPRFRYRPELVNYQPVSPEAVRAVPFGTGFIDYDAFFRGLRDGGFNGIATYEMCSPIRGGGSLANLDTYARCYLDWMRERGFDG